LVAFQPIAGSFEAENVGVVHDSVNYRRGDGLVAEYLALPKDRLLVRIRDAW